MVVQDNNLAAQMSALRKVLGGDVIATIPGRGYRFVARIESADGAAAPASPGYRAGVAAARRCARNLPLELIPLLGRGDELAQLRALVDAHRLVTIAGAGGIGKSLLAQHLLQERRSAYPQGVCWVELAPVTTAAAVPAAIASALGIDIASGEPLAALAAAAAPLQLLLALDNAEHLLDAVADVCAVLHAAAPGLRLLLTSQAPLQLGAERVLRIAPLAVPEATLPARDALQFGAVALFVDRAGAVDGRFALTDENAPAVIELCRALDGLPLAIELAAARAQTLGLRTLRSSLGDRLQLLRARHRRDAPQRQQTLRAALQWSYDLLPPREQQVFRGLGVLPGSAPLAFIQRVLLDPADGGGLDEWAVLDALDTLVDRSLVAVLAADADASTRYRLLESPRAFALERLAQAGERQALQRRHAAATALACDALYKSHFSGRIGVDDWQLRLAGDLDHARDALAWARAASDTAIELGVGATLLRALPPSQHAERMALADALARRAGADAPPVLQQRAWIEISCAWADTRKTASRDAAQRALALARTLDEADGDRFTLYFALCRTVSAAVQAGEPDAATAPLAELQALEDPAWPAQRLLWGADAAQLVARFRGDTAEALRRSRRLVALDLERGSDGSIALGNLIDHELAAGDAAAAARTGARLVALLEGSRHEFSLALARINLCAALLALDDGAQAQAVAQACWPQARAFDMPHVAAVYLGLLAALQSRPQAAARLLGYADASYAARREQHEGNEAQALARARALATAALGEAAFGAAHADGAALRDIDIAELAFSCDDC